MIIAWEYPENEWLGGFEFTCQLKFGYQMNLGKVAEPVLAGNKVLHGVDLKFSCKSVANHYLATYEYYESL